MENFIPFRFSLNLADVANKKWLIAVGLKNYAFLDWESLEDNIYAPTQLALVKKTDGVLKSGTKITPSLIAAVFKLPNFPEQESILPTTDEDMQKEFGNPVGSKNYYQMKSLDAFKRD